MKKVIKFILTLLLGASIVAVISMFSNSNDVKTKKGTATNEIIKQTLVDASDLITQKLIFEGTVYYDNQGIPVLTRSTFYMQYKATVSAGINLENVTIDEIDNDNFKIVITAPKAEILDVNVDPDSLEFDQTSLTMFDLTSKIDTKEAISFAANDCKENAKTSGILENADRQTTTLLKGLMATEFPKYKVEVNLVGA